MEEQYSSISKRSRYLVSLVLKNNSESVSNYDNSSILTENGEEKIFTTLSNINNFDLENCEAEAMDVADEIFSNSRSPDAAVQEYSQEGIDECRSEDPNPDPELIEAVAEGDTDGMDKCGSSVDTCNPDPNPDTGLEDEEAEGNTVRPRKRLSHPDKWNKFSSKRKRNLGEEYISTSGKVVLSKSLKNGCSSECSTCEKRLNEDQRRLILSAFWGMGDINRQRDFIVRNTEVVQPKYQYKVNGSERSNNHAFYFNVDCERVRVCKKMFMATLAIGDRLIRSSFKKLKDDVVEPDLRGKHNKHRTLHPEIKINIRKHIESFPRIESHYLRAQTKREYIDGSLNIATMYRLYVEFCKSNNIQYGNIHMYSKIFNTEYNIGFFLPKKDQCAFCESYKNSSDEQKENMQQRYDEHQLNKRLSRAEKERDSDNSKKGEVIAVCFDLQAVLSVPAGDISHFYYKRKLSCYNFTMFHLRVGQGYCFFWDETIAKRGCNEIGTCVLDFLVNFCKDKNVIFYSDNCVGQQKNKYLIAMYMYAVKFLGVKSITHKFLIVGHSQNEGDSMHSVIEKEKSRALRSKPLYIPAQIVPILSTAKKSRPPYIVKELSTTDFKDLKDLCCYIGNNFTNNTDNEKVTWQEIKIVKIMREEDSSFYYKTSYKEEEPWYEVKVKNGTNLRGRPTNYQIKNAYESGPAISDAKKKISVTFVNKTLFPQSTMSSTII